MGRLNEINTLGGGGWVIDPKWLPITDVNNINKE